MSQWLKSVDWPIVITWVELIIAGALTFRAVKSTRFIYELWQVEGESWLLGGIFWLCFFLTSMCVIFGMLIFARLVGLQLQPVAGIITAALLIVVLSLPSTIERAIKRRRS